jgi:hypothetical protein
MFKLDEMNDRPCGAFSFMTTHTDTVNVSRGNYHEKQANHCILNHSAV